jgi:Protein of unknown function (DUF3052)
VSGAAGYSGTPLPKKLGIKEDARVALVGAPPEAAELIAPLPTGVELRTQLRSEADVIVFFARRRRELEQRFDALVAKLERDGSLWVAWPKRTSGIETDMTENIIREVALPRGLVDTKVCAISDVWSGLRLVRRRENR